MLREEFAHWRKHQEAANQQHRETYVDSEALQKHFNVSRATVHNWIHDDGCPHEMRGKVLRFKLSAVEDWFTRRQPLRPVKSAR